MIYFISSPNQKAIKIGHTGDNVYTRLSVIQVGNPEKLELLGTMEGDEEKEAQLHEWFESYRIRGEWFENDSTVINYIKYNSIPQAPLGPVGYNLKR